jgi:paraquat-inducible protein A
VLRKYIFLLLVLAYAAGALPAAWNVVARTQDSTQAIDGILKLYNLQNEGAQSLEQFNKAHPLLGLFVSSPIQHNLELSSTEESNEALHSEVPHLLKTVRQESSLAAWSSWSLLCLSLFYVVAVIAFERSFTGRPVLFALTAISVVFFVIGIFAPAMVIWTAPTIPMEAGKLEFVLQHEVRGIAAIIWELITTGHWIIGGLLLLFSILTPLTKASLTFFVTASHSKTVNYRVGQVLHTIGKWSMADVFVAGVLLALFALKSQEATKSIPCLGIYYFIGYCLLSLTTTELLVHSDIVAGNERKKARKKMGTGVIGGLFAGLLCFVLGSSAYTYQQYTVNTKQKVSAISSPSKLNNSDLVLPVHK